MKKKKHEKTVNIKEATEQLKGTLLRKKIEVEI